MTFYFWFCHFCHGSLIYCLKELNKAIEDKLLHRVANQLTKENLPVYILNDG